MGNSFGIIFQYENISFFCCCRSSPESHDSEVSRWGFRVRDNTAARLTWPWLWPNVTQKTCCWTTEVWRREGLRGGGGEIKPSGGQSVRNSLLILRRYPIIPSDTFLWGWRGWSTASRERRSRPETADSLITLMGGVNVPGVNQHAARHRCHRCHALDRVDTLRRNRIWTLLFFYSLMKVLSETLKCRLLQHGARLHWLGYHETVRPFSFLSTLFCRSGVASAVRSASELLHCELLR